MAASLDHHDAEPSHLGLILPQTEIRFARANATKRVTLTGSLLHAAEGGGRAGPNSIFLGDFDFEKLGNGGLDAEFNRIFRRAFASRI